MRTAVYATVLVYSNAVAQGCWANNPCQFNDRVQLPLGCTDKKGDREPGRARAALRGAQSLGAPTAAHRTSLMGRAHDLCSRTRACALRGSISPRAAAPPAPLPARLRFCLVPAACRHHAAVHSLPERLQQRTVLLVSRQPGA